MKERSAMLPQVVQDALSDQINMELSASYNYLAMSTYCKSQSFHGFGQWMAAQSQEEYGHAMKLYNFMTAPDFSEFTWLEFDGVMWVNYGMGQQSFNAEELPIENEILFWTGTNWVNSSRYIYTWDIESRLTEQISQWWSSGVYENSYRYTYFYGPNGISESYYYYWSGGAWVDGDKYVYSYNGFGELEYTTRLYWNGTNYVNDHRTVFYYNPDGLVEEELYQNYNGFIWEDNDRTLYNYNPDGFLIEELVQWWNGTDWMNNYRYSAILGPNNMPDYTINEFWDGTVWQDYCRFRYTYEEYDDGTVAVPEYNISYAMKIFPNPAQRNVNILVKSQINSSGQLQIRDISGQLVGSMNVALNVGENLFQIDLEAIDLISGEYIISIRTNSKTFIGKLLVQ